MDPISIMTLVASTTAATYKVASEIYIFLNQTNTVDAQVESLAGEVTGLRRALDAMAVVLASPIVRGERATAAANAPVWAAVAGSLGDTRLTVERLSDAIGDERPVGRSLFRRSVRVVKLRMSNPDIVAIRMQVNTHVNSLQLSLQMVTILIASLSPDTAAAETLGASVDKLTEALDRMRVMDEDLKVRDSSSIAQYAAHSGQVSRAADAMLARKFDLLNDDSRSIFSEQERKESQSIVLEVLRDFKRSIYDDASVDDASTLLGAEDGDGEGEDDSDSDADMLALTQRHLQKGDEKMATRDYADAERHYRDGLRNLPMIQSGFEGVPVDDARLHLAVACQHLGKLDEAELMLTMLARVEPGRRITSRTLDATHLLAQTHLANHDFDSALQHCMNAMSGRRKLLGKTHPSYFSSVRLLALIYESNGDVISAETYEARIPGGAMMRETAEANKFVLDLFSGYSRDEVLAMSLDERRRAVQELSAAAFIERPDRASAGTARVTFLAGKDSLNIGAASRWAAHEGKELALRWCLSRLVITDTTTLAETATRVLITAAARGNQGCVRLLLRAGADPDTTDGNGRTATLWAALWGHESTVKTLIDFGADVDKAEKDKSTPLGDASYKGNDGVVRLLLVHGADPNKKLKGDKTALFIALEQRKPDVVRALLDGGAEVNMSDGRGQTPLLVAAANRSTAMMELLLAKGADARVVTPSGSTVLLSYSDDAGMMERLIAAGADVRAKDKQGLTPLLQIAEYEKPEATEVLLRHGADAESKMYDRTPYQTAKLRGHGASMAVYARYGLAKD